MPPVDERTQLLRLMRLLSYRRGIVTLASGKQSDFFIDCKQTVLTAKGHALVGSLLLKALQHLPEHEAVAGVVLGGCPLASAVSLTSHLTGRPLQALYVRKEAKDHGTKRLIEGGVQRGMRVAMVEDVITTGGSTLRAVETLRDAGVLVVGVDPRGPAAEARIQNGDVIVEVERKRVDDTDALEKRLSQAGDRALLLIRRGNNEQFVSIKRAD